MKKYKLPTSFNQFNFFTSPKVKVTFSICIYCQDTQCYATPVTIRNYAPTIVKLINSIHSLLSNKQSVQLTNKQFLMFSNSNLIKTFYGVFMHSDPPPLIYMALGFLKNDRRGNQDFLVKIEGGVGVGGGSPYREFIKSWGMYGFSFHN